MLDIADPDQLSQYLEACGLASNMTSQHFQMLGGGVSCITIRVNPPAHPSFIIKQALPRLQVASRWLTSPDRAHREAEGIQCLQQLLPGGSIPALIRDDPENHLLVMEDVPFPHDNWKRLLLAGKLVDDHAIQFGTLLAVIHVEALQRADLLEPVFRDRTFFESLRMEAYYEYTARQIPVAAPFIDRLISNTRKHCVTLVHGDYSPKNVLVRKGKLVLLDHETIHWGDPMFDVGFSLTHFLSKANHMPHRRDDFMRLALRHWQSYCQQAGTTLTDSENEQRAVMHTMACLLARVHGRSPLEYLDPAARQRQSNFVLSLLNESPLKIQGLMTYYLASLA